eukprot:SAG22_NODE_1953_length_3264_cov_3.629068_1_plen_222_part_10
MLYDYASHGTPDHVEVFCGDVVLVQLRPSPDWWYVQTTDQGSVVQSGWMPAAYLGGPPEQAAAASVAAPPSADVDASEAGGGPKIAEEDLSDEDFDEPDSRAVELAQTVSAEQQATAAAHEAETITIQRHVRGRLTRARVQKIKKKEYQRRRIVMEILSTENTFNEGLRVMNHEFLTQLRWKCQQAEASRQQQAAAKKKSARRASVSAGMSLEFPNEEDVNV